MLRSKIAAVLENPSFYVIGSIAGLVGYVYGILGDGHILLVLGAAGVGLYRWFRNRETKRPS
jgi:hypothetical protein